MKRTRIILLIITVSALLAGIVLIPEEKIDEKPYLREIAPGISFSAKKGAPPHYRAENSVVAFNTFDIVPSIRGYAGPIKLLLAIDGKGAITGLKVLEHKETKNYVHYMERPEYLRQFLGKSINDPFIVDKDIDAISRATVSVEALAKTVKVSSREIAARVLNITVKGGNGEKQGDVKWIFSALVFLAAFSVYTMTRRSKRYLKARDGILVLSFFVIGLYLSTPFSILHIFNLLLVRFSSSILWYIIIISTLISIALAGRLYCGWLCPFGALAEFIGRVPIKKWTISVEADDRRRRLKYVILALVIIVVFVSRHPEYGNYETYVTLFSFHGNVLTWALVVIMLIINVRVERFWCRYLCPVGAFAGLLSKRDNRYISGHDCPMANKANPHISECIRCNRCYTAANIKEKM